MIIWEYISLEGGNGPIMVCILQKLENLNSLHYLQEY